MALEITDPVEQLSQYVEDLCGYRLPWIVSGLLRIARETLSIQAQIFDEYIRSYPSMMKYGLPDPVATWAMSAGIDTRETALFIAEKYYGTLLDSLHTRRLSNGWQVFLTIRYAMNSK